MKLTNHQQEVFDSIINDIEAANDFGQCFYGSLVGPAGTGKTVMTTKLVQYFINEFNMNITATTPTHKSLKVLNDMLKSVTSNKKLKTKTIHSFLSLKMQQKEDKMILVPDSTMTSDLATKILLVDESSMVSTELFGYIESHVRKAGIQVVLFIGDSMQLLPIEGGLNPVYSKLKQYQLTEVVRQASESSILFNATLIRKEIENKTFNKNVFKQFKFDDDFVKFEDEIELLKDYCLNSNPDKVLSAFTNNKVDYYNQFGRAYEHRFLSDVPEFVEGEKLVMNEAYYPNQTDSGIKNGEDFTIGNIIKEFDEKNQIYVWKFQHEETEVNVKIVASESKQVFQSKLALISEKAKQLKSDKYFKESSDMWQEFWRVKAEYADVKYAHAVTVHKLQGSTIEDIYFNLSETTKTCRDQEMLFRLIYVAITRARHKVRILI